MQESSFEYSRHRPVLAAGETVLWQGKPKRSAFIATKSLTLMPIAILWLILDLSLMGSILGGSGMEGFLIPFFLLHMMPVWIWLFNVLTAGRRWQNTAYYVTNRRIILQDGFLAVNETSLFYKDLHNAQVRIGLLDKLFHTGDIVLNESMIVVNSRRHQQGYRMEDLEDPHAVYSRIQKIILDMQTDIEFPNAYRPENNPGYNTNYRP